jgi:hypothetical protein
VTTWLLRGTHTHASLSAFKIAKNSFPGSHPGLISLSFFLFLQRLNTSFLTLDLGALRDWE